MKPRRRAATTRSAHGAPAVGRRRGRGTVVNDDPALEETLARAVRMVAAVRRRQSAITARYGVTMLQAAALHALRDGGSTNITELSRRLHLNQSTVSALVVRMERDGLLARTRDRRDRRAVKLELTDRGLEVTRIVNVSPFAFFRLLLGSLDAGDRRDLARLLEKLERFLERHLAAIARRPPR